MPGLGVLLLADTNGLTDGMPGGKPGRGSCCGGGGGGHMPPTPGGGPPLGAPRMALPLLWLLLPSLMLRCCRMNWWRRSMNPSLKIAPLPELMPDKLASLR